MNWFFAFLLLALPLAAENQVNDKIDRALAYADAGAYTLSVQAFQSLLQQNLTSVERATVIYNLATLYAMMDRFWDSLQLLNQIDSNMYDELVKASPQVAAELSYNGTISSIRYAQEETAKILKSETLRPNEVSLIQQALDSARQYNQQLLQLMATGSESKLDVSASLLAVHNQEEIADLQAQLGKIQFVLTMLEQSKTDLAENFLDYLQDKIDRLSNILVAIRPDNAPRDLYVEGFGASYETEISFMCQRLIRFLLAPASHEQSVINRFLSDQLKEQLFAFQESIEKRELVALMQSLSRLSNCLEMIQAQSSDDDIKALLDARVDMFVQLSFLDPASPLAIFWQNEFQALSQFAFQYIERKASLAKSQVQETMYEYIDKRLHEVPTTQLVLDDLVYWKVLSTAPEKTLQNLANELHGSKTIELKDRETTFQALLDRLSAQNLEEAKKPLNNATTLHSALLLFQDIMESWYAVAPNPALQFLFSKVNDGMALIQTNSADSWTTFVARTDYQLLMHLLSLKKLKSTLQTDTRQDLVDNIGWFSDAKRPNLQFYRMSLELGWLNAMLTEDQGSIESVINMVDMSVDFQNKTLSLLQFSGTSEFTELLSKLTALQTELVAAVQKPLEALPQKGDKIKKVIDLLQDAQEALKKQTTDLSKMQQVADDLSQASKILHSMKSESQAESNASNSESQSPQLTQNQDLSKQMQNKALQLTPENSIRLLQEMEQEDRNLGQQATPKVSVKRPW